MIRFAEAALQVRGQAGEHQVDGARNALGHAYGGGSQFFAMWIVAAKSRRSRRLFAAETCDRHALVADLLQLGELE